MKGFFYAFYCRIQVKIQRHFLDYESVKPPRRSFTGNGHPIGRYRLIMITTILLIIAALICFAIFFKAIDFFDKI